MQTEHLKNKIVLYSKGANRETDPELLFSQENSSEYLDARNARPTSIDGNTGSIEKIKGEVIKYTNTAGLTGYVCVGRTSVNNNLVEIYAPTIPPLEGIVRINGVIVLRSLKFEQKVDYPLQIDINEAKGLSEFFITDNRVPPYCFNIEDMVASLTSNPTKYFAAFNPLLYQVNLQSPLDIMAFVDLINVGGGGGLPVGHYQYQMRYTSEAGDRTNWCHPTPMIPVMQSLSSSSREYPWVKTFGGPPAPQSLTALAPRLRFRVTNLYNYDYIEIKRIAYNQGAGIDFTPNGVVVAKIDIYPGEISVKEYIDPQESNTNIALSATDETQELVEVERAKAIRYFDRRLTLMNVKLASKESNLTFLELNGKTGWPVIDKLGKGGYNDPWNHVYKKAFMHGEKYGFGTGVYDGVGTRGFATKVRDLTNYQIPNRRDVISTETSNYSFDGTVKAADTTASNAVSQTHEVFDLSNPVYKTDHCNFKNIIFPGKILGLTGNRGVPKVKEDCDETNEEIENHGADVTANAASVSYQPYTPVRQTDPDVEGHNYVVNTKIAIDDVQGDPITGAPVPSGPAYNYRPKGFAPDYYAQGMMIAGVDNFPKWAKSFAIVRTPAAKRVVCQGLGYYALTKGKFKLLTNESLGGKEQNKLWAYFPDIESGIVSSDKLNDIIANPQNYKIQCVSPLGFFSEQYAAESNLLLGNRDRCIDMVSYARLLRDLRFDANNQVNPTEDSAMGVDGGDGYNYIAYDKFRNTGQNPNTFGGDPAKGNRLLDIAQIKRKVDGRGTFLEIEFTGNIYGKASVGGNSESNFEDQGLKDWTEPLYMINIISDGAEIADQNIQKYKQTSHYQKLESIIGKSTGIADQKYILVDERWEDCISAPNASTYGASTDRYIYIRKPDGTEEKWINVTYKTTTQIAAINADIVAFGFYNTDVKGMYRHNNIDGLNRFYEIIFNVLSYYPSINDFIIVKYDNTAPIRIFGGDTYVGETIFAPIDRQASAKDKQAETMFALGVGLPFKNFKINARHYTIRKAGASINNIQDEVWFRLGFLRQLCVMFTVESRTACHLAYNQSTSPNQFFPLINYVIRPNRWDRDDSMEGNTIYQDYSDDYGDEKSNWKWGGFRFLQQINPDYSCEPRITFFSRPEYGFVEKTEYPTRVMWSLSRPINVQDTPGIKSFPANNSYDIDDDQGEIKYAYDAMSSRGENLYAFTNKGICFLVTRKSVLSDLGGGDIGYMAADSFVKQQMWLSKDIGMKDEWWRSAAEGFIPVPIGDESSVRQEALFFANNESVFMFSENSVKDIGRIGYYNKLYNKGLSKVLGGYLTPITSVYDKKHQEYLLYIGGTVDNMFAFSKANMAWNGTYDFKFEQLVVNGLDTLGIRNAEVYTLNQGYIMNGSPVVFEVESGASQDQFFGKEFGRVRVNSLSGIKPTRIEFRKVPDGPVICELDPSQGAYYVKNYDGFEQWIPRMNDPIPANRKLFQGRLIIFKILHNLASEFKVIDASIFYKLLK